MKKSRFKKIMKGILITLTLEGVAIYIDFVAIKVADNLGIQLYENLPSFAYVHLRSTVLLAILVMPFVYYMVPIEKVMTDGTPLKFIKIPMWLIPAIPTFLFVGFRTILVLLGGCLRYLFSKEVVFDLKGVVDESFMLANLMLVPSLFVCAYVYIYIKVIEKRNAKSNLVNKS